MATNKKVKSIVKIQLPAGKANPSPPVGPALGQHGVNIMEFCKAFNAKTKDKGDTTIPVIITIYQDKSFDFILKAPPASVLIKKAIKLEKGSGNSVNDRVGTITKETLEEIAKVKMPDLNANTIGAAVKIIQGTARSMGVYLSE